MEAGGVTGPVVYLPPVRAPLSPCGHMSASRSMAMRSGVSRNTSLGKDHRWYEPS
jgi:hypothetical protein